MLFQFTLALSSLFEKHLSPSTEYLIWPNIETTLAEAGFPLLEIKPDVRRWQTSPFPESTQEPHAIAYQQNIQLAPRKRTFYLDRIPDDTPVQAEIHRDELTHPTLLKEGSDFNIDRATKKLVLSTSKNNDEGDCLLLKFQYMGIEELRDFHQSCILTLYSEDYVHFQSLANQISGILFVYKQELLETTNKSTADNISDQFQVEEQVKDFKLEENIFPNIHDIENADSQRPNLQLQWKLTLTGSYKVTREAASVGTPITKILSPGIEPTDKPEHSVDIRAGLISE